MGKVEILTLISGVVLSIALALIVIPIFSKSEEMLIKNSVFFNLIQVQKNIEMEVMDGSINKRQNPSNIGIATTYYVTYDYKTGKPPKKYGYNGYLNIDLYYLFNSHGEFVELKEIRIFTEKDINLEQIFQNDLIIKDGKTTLKNTNCKKVTLYEKKIECRLVD